MKLAIVQHFNKMSVSDDQILTKRSLRISPQFARAKAVLCDVLVRQSIVNGDKGLLEVAQNECESAKTDKPNFAELELDFV